MKRYDVKGCHDPDCMCAVSVTESPTGEYVRHEDVVALEARLTEAKRLFVAATSGRLAADMPRGLYNQIGEWLRKGDHP